MMRVLLSLFAATTFALPPLVGQDVMRMKEDEEKQAVMNKKQLAPLLDLMTHMGSKDQLEKQLAPFLEHMGSAMGSAMGSVSEKSVSEQAVTTGFIMTLVAIAMVTVMFGPWALFLFALSMGLSGKAAWCFADGMTRASFIQGKCNEIPTDVPEDQIPQICKIPNLFEQVFRVEYNSCFGAGSLGPSGSAAETEASEAEAVEKWFAATKHELEDTFAASKHELEDKLQQTLEMSIEQADAAALPQIQEALVHLQAKLAEVQAKISAKRANN